MTRRPGIWISTNRLEPALVIAAMIVRSLSLVSLLAGVVGCSESMEDRMMARARQRTARAETEEVEAAAAAAPPPAPAPLEAVAAVAVAAAAPPSETAATVPELAAPLVVTGVDIPPPPAIDLDNGGRLLAFDRGDSTVGLFDMENKKLIRAIGGPSFTPAAFSLDPGGRRLFAGDTVGNVQVFSVDEVSGLDAFERQRRRGQVASQGQFAHAHAITAIAPVGYAGAYVTGDREGDVRLWLEASDAASSLSVGNDSVVGMQSYGDGKFLFAAVAPTAGKASSSKGKVVYWRLENGQPDAESLRDYVELAGSPTRMIQSSSGGGLAVGDTTGQVRVWAPQDGKIRQSVLTTSSAPVTGLAFVDGAKGVIAADQQGNVRRFELPIVQRRNLDLPTVNVRMLRTTEDGEGVLFAADSSALVLGVVDAKVRQRYRVPGGSVVTDACSLDASPVRLIAATTDQATIEFFEAATATSIGRLNLRDQVTVLTPIPGQRAVMFATSVGRYGKIIAPSQSFALPQSGDQLTIASDSGSDRVVLVAKENRLARLYDASDGRIAGSTSLASMPGELTSIAFHGGVSVFGNDQGELWVWQSDQQRSRPVPLLKLPDAKAIRAIHVGDAGIVRVVDDGGVLRTLNVADVSSEAIAAAPTVKISTSFTQASLGDSVAVFGSGNELEIVSKGVAEATRVKLPRGTVTALAASPRSAEFVVANDQGDLWLSTTTELGPAIKLPSEFVCRQATWDSTGKTIIASDNRRIVTIEASTGFLVAEHDEPTGIEQLFPRADGGCLVVDSKGAIRPRLLASIVWSDDDPVRINDFAYRDTDSQLIAVTETGQLWLMDAATGSIETSHQVSDAAISQIETFEGGLVLALEQKSGRILDCTDPASPRTWREGLPPTKQILTRARQTRIATLATDGRLLVHQLAGGDTAPLEIKVDGDVERAMFIDASSLAIRSQGKASMQVVPIDENGRGIGLQFKTVKDLIELPQLGAIAIADGTSSVSVFDVAKSQTKALVASENVSFDRLAVDLAGTKLAASASGSGRLGSGSTVVIWNLKDPESQPLQWSVPGAITAIAFSADSARVHVALDDRSVRSFDSLDAVELERNELAEIPRTLSIADHDAVWIGGDAGIAVRAPRRLSSRLQRCDGAVRLLNASQGKYVLAATDKSVTIESLTSSSTAKPDIVTLAQGEPLPLAAIIRADGNAIAVSFGGATPHVKVWKLGRDMAWGGELEPSVSVALRSPADAIQFVSDSKLIVGERSGLIEVIDLSNQKSAFQFIGHESPIASLAIAEGGNQLVSCSADRSVRRWSIPAGSLEGRDDAIPQAEAVASTDLQNLPEIDAAFEEVSAEEDAFADVRAALLTGSGISAEGEVFSLFEDDSRQTSEVASKYRELKRIEASTESTDAVVARLVNARRDFHEQRRSLTSLKRAAGSKTFADNQSNLLFSAETKFDFSGGVRTVEPQLNDGRFVYAAMPRSAQQPGSLYVWDFGVTGVQTHAWDDLQLEVRELFGLPDGRGVLTMPDLQVFSQDGTSRSILEALRYATSSDDPPYGEERLFAIANRGLPNQESVALQVFRNEDLMRQSAAPVATLRGFESEITAMAFANTHRAIAFNVRERNGYRLLIADPSTLDPRQITLVEEGSMSNPWIIQPNSEGENQEKGSPGPSTLCFSPDDRMLVVHSKISEERYAYSVYRIEWPASGLPSAAGIHRFVGPVEREGPFLDESANRPLFFVTRRLTPKERAERGTSFAGSTLIAFRRGNQMQVVSCVVGSTLRSIPLLTSSGRPRYSVTQDGQWLITADDRGNVQIGNLGTGKVIDLTADGRPAHSGPVVGVAISDTDAALQVPEYAVTVGEENRLKVWDTLSRLRQ